MLSWPVCVHGDQDVVVLSLRLQGEGNSVVARLPFFMWVRYSFVLAICGYSILLRV